MHHINLFEMSCSGIDIGYQIGQGEYVLDIQSYNSHIL